MKKIIALLAILAVSSTVFAEDLSCSLLNGNVSGKAAVTINKLNQATLSIRGDSLDFNTFSGHSGPSIEYSPRDIYLSASDFAPSGKFTISEDQRYLSAQFQYKNGGTSSMTSGEVVGVFDLQTKQFRIKTRTGFGPFKTLKLDYLVQCN